MITTFTIDALIDAQLCAETFKAIKAAFDLDIENARNDVRELLREQFVTVDAGEPTPAALRMRKTREKQRLLKAQGSLNDGVTEANTVREPCVTSDNILSLSKGIEKEESKPVVIARGRKSYPELFEKFWSAFPTDGGMSKSEAAKVFDKLPEEDQQSAINGIPGLRKWAAGQGTTYRMIHAVNYLKQRRFEGLAGFNVQTSEFSAARELARRIGRA